ncbi:Co2+/Mg2+ efflux protein ApaG [Deinococcus sp.]|uniref:Co2+/Mg2+ efflux protein ApaG n=1 Tax=Deinococcus sp. TaxID=47478 RepID=UPI003C7B837F
MSQMSEQPDVRVSVEVRFRTDASQPQQSPQGRWLFQYVVRIENQGDESWQIMGREWTITDGLGRVTQVSGEGVVGQTPVLAPGGVYVYDSFVTLEILPGRMVGAYLIRNAWGQEARAQIPEFALALPPELVQEGDGPGRVLN